MFFALSNHCYAGNINKEYRGLVSWYKTGSEKYTVAHRTLPFGTVVSLYNPKNGKKIKAVVNDRDHILGTGPSTFPEV